jgi:arylsulfatase A
MLALRFAAIAALLLTYVPLRAATRPPNFLVILADDLSAKELACYGNKEHKTPNLDALAAGGMRFRTCYATPLCSPTRVELMTGRYGFRTGWNSLIGRPYAPPRTSPQFDIGAAQITFADVLKSAGYATALAGKWQLSGKLPDLIHDCGFDEYSMWAYSENLPPGVTHTGAFQHGGKTTSRYWNPCIMTNGKYVPTQPDDYGPDLFNRFIIDFMARHKNQPFVAYNPMPLTHGPHDPTPDPQHPGKRMPQGMKSNVEYMDHLVGELLTALDKHGLRENTIILFAGDNGTAGDGKGDATELGVRVPLIVNCPGVVKADVVSDELVDLSDVLPTLADFAGAGLPKDRTIDGRSFAPILRGEKGNPRDWIFSYIRNERVLRDKRWLLEGDGRFFDCGDKRDHEGYIDVTKSTDPQVVAARERFQNILKDLPAPAEDAEKPAKDAGKKKTRKRASPA